MKKLILPFYNVFTSFVIWTKKFSFMRKWQTRNFHTGFLALGERNTSIIPSKWVTIDWSGADFNLNFQNNIQLPFPDNSQQVIYSSHMLEHLRDESIHHLLQECYRVLKPGGLIRFEVPDAQKLFEKYKAKDVGYFSSFAKENEENLVKKYGMDPTYGETHIAFLGLISCYISQMNNGHVPVLVSRQDLDEKMKNTTLDEFVDWSYSLQTAEQKKSGGHVNGLYFSKLKKMMEKNSFQEVKEMPNRISRKKGLSLRGIERQHRSHYSVITEAIK